MSRLKHDKLSDMLAAADAAQQAAEQKSRRLEIKFARSDKGHALMRSAKLQASVAELETQLGQLQDDSHLKVSFAQSRLDHNAQCAMYVTKSTMHNAHYTMHNTSSYAQTCSTRAIVILVCQQGAQTTMIYPGNNSGCDVYHFMQLHNAVAARCGVEISDSQS